MCRINYTIYNCTHHSLDRLSPCPQNPHPLLATLYQSTSQSTPTQSSYDLSQALRNLSYVPSPAEIFFECEEYNGREGVWVDYCCGKCWAEWWVGFLRVVGENVGGEEEMGLGLGGEEGDVVMVEAAKEEGGVEETMVRPEEVALPEDKEEEEEEGGDEEMKEGALSVEVK